MKSKMVGFCTESTYESIYASRIRREVRECNFLLEKSGKKCHAYKSIPADEGCSAISDEPTMPNGGGSAAPADDGDGDEGGDDADPDGRRHITRTAPTPHVEKPLTRVVKTRLMRLPEVQSRTGYGRSAIYEMMRSGKFPVSVKLGARAIGFVESEIDGWIAERIGKRAEAA